jgi:O-acetyl-ADP-ribose deacetylase (regulator of RNase III)
MANIKAIKGDITTQNTDVIVNNASPTLLGGGGVDGAIHQAAGPALMEECRKLDGCRIGGAKITKGYNLPAKFIIHAVGPVYGRENGREAELLASSYESSLNLAKEYNLRTISFPSIATGIFGYPVEESAEIAVKTVRNFCKLNNFPDEVVFVLFEDYDLKVYEEELAKSGN